MVPHHSKIWPTGRAINRTVNPAAAWKRKVSMKPALIAGFFVVAMSLASGTAAQMMMLPGQFDVSPTGAALYSVPIEVPPGTGGMSPALTLDYDSDGGNGLLGVGWNLGGLPSIGRCPKTVATDGVRGRVDFTANDRFCMDGQRLVVTVGTYGAANSEYRTEIEGFTKVVAYGAAGNGPSYFKAWTKSGQIIEFGNTTDSRILATGTATARSWAANKISDTKGNYLTIAYTNDTANGQAYPTRIDYTGNAGSTPVLAPYNSVRFEYEARPDIVPLHIAGSMVKNTVRLKKIKTYQGAMTVVRTYELVYGTGSSTQRSKITSIKLCDGAGTNCLPATSFSMTTASLTFPTEVGSGVGVGSSVVLYFGDWNGDGVTDVMNWNPSTGANNWYLNNGSLSFTTTVNPIPIAQISGSSSQLFLGDWDGDAITDVLWWNPGNGNNRWFVNSSSGGAPAFTQTTNPIATSAITSGSLAPGDWNGDGKTDLVWYNSSGVNRFFKLTSSSPLTFTQYNSLITLPTNMGSHVLVTGEFNGDSFSDVLIDNPVLTSGGFWAFVGDGNMGFTQRPFASDLAGGSIGLGDWNGDGLTDVMTHRFTSGSNRFWLNDGTGQFGTVIGDPITPTTIVNYVPYVGDWNADGLSDLMFHLPSAGSNRWFTTSWSSAGALQFTYTADPILAANIAGSGGAMAFGDWNGRAFEAPMWWRASNGSNRWYRNDAATPPERLTSITTGLDSTTAFTLKPITDNSVYTKEATATYPVIDIEAPFYVVSRVDAANGIGGNYSSTYSYAGAKIDLQGRGFLGFRQQVSTDLQTSVAQTLTFRQDYPYIGFVLEDKKVRSGVVLNDRDNIYNATTTGTAPNIRKWPYLQSVTEASKDLNGTAFPTVTTDYTYDAYGNPLTIAVSTPADGATRTTTNTYSNNATTWILGRLLSSTVASTTPDLTPVPTGCQSNCNSTTPFFSVNNALAAEGSAATFTVTRTGAATGSYSVNYATANGAATAGSDYTAKSGTLTFATGEATKTVSVTTLSDAVSEGSETFTLNLSAPTGGATISDGQGAGTITNVAPAPSFSISDATAAEGSSAVFTVTRSGTSTGSYSVNYATANGTATAGSDYTTASGTLTFASGETSKTVSVATLSDAVSEVSEAFTLNLSAPTGGATITDSQGAGTITNVVPASFSVSDASGDEETSLVFVVTRSGSTAGTNTVSYATANGTAVAPSDYVAKSGTLTFAAGVASQSVSVSANFNPATEPNEVFYLNLSAPSGGATITDGQGVGTIFDVFQDPMCGDVAC